MQAEWRNVNHSFLQNQPKAKSRSDKFTQRQLHLQTACCIYWYLEPWKESASTSLFTCIRHDIQVGLNFPVV